MGVSQNQGLGLRASLGVRKMGDYSVLGSDWAPLFLETTRSLLNSTPTSSYFGSPIKATLRVEGLE